jgi:hypothetical protein
MLRLQAQPYTIIIRDIPASSSLETLEQLSYTHAFTFGSYLYVRKVIEVYDQNQPISTCLFSSDIGVAAVEQSAIIIDKTCYIAVAQYIFALALPDLTAQWKCAVDASICFGVYALPLSNGLISHGEQDIARLALNGTIAWTSSGKDIFTNGMTIDDDHIIAVDFNNETYHIDIATGNSKLIPHQSNRISRFIRRNKPAG